MMKENPTRDQNTEYFLQVHVITQSKISAMQKRLHADEYL